MYNKTAVSVVMPMFNEKDYTLYTVRELGDFFKEQGIDFELIVVDDGSTDGSSQIIDHLSQGNSFLKVIHFEKNSGIGRALRSGFNSATKDIIIYTDFDLPVEKDKIKESIDILKGNNVDLIVGRRIGTRETAIRHLYSFVYNQMIKKLFRIGLNDINCALKVFRRDMVSKMELKSDGPFIDAELLIRARNKGFKILELEVANSPRLFGCSKFAARKNIIRTVSKMISELLRLYPEIKYKNEKTNH
jgi:glycosyltransferase involved in cell wall biosynthesis